IQDELKRVQDEDLGQVSRELYPAIIKMGLVPALRSLVSRFADLLEIDLSFDQRIADLDAAGEAGLPEKRRLGIYRIAEEALNNVMKHGSASHAHVTVTRDGNNLVLTIIDDGRGFEHTELDNCHGLMMMRDYGNAIGGKTEITSSVRQGTSIRLVLPLPSSNSLVSMLRKAKNPVSFYHGF
ncbi:MAG: sensor histidine kinase, partial [Dehalococcoidia bacterium]